MHRDSLPTPTLSECMERIPADEWPQRMSVWGRVLTLALLPSFFALMIGAMIWLVLILLMLVLQVHRAPLWMLVSGLPLVVLVIIWQSVEIYREIVMTVYRETVAFIERGIAIAFAGTSEAFGFSQQAMELVYSALCFALIPISGWVTFALKDSAPLVLIQRVLEGKVQWGQVPVWTAAEAAGYVFAFAIIFAISSSLILSKKFRGVLVRPKLEPKVSVERNAGSIEQKLRIAHISDLHVMADGQVLAENPSVRLGAESVVGLFSSLSSGPAPDAVVLSGDLTDKGDIDSWRVLLSCPDLQSIHERLVIAPGNHDLNPIETGLWKSIRSFADFRRTGQNLRALRYLQAANALMGNRAELVCPYTQRLATLSQVMERARPDIDAWSSRKSKGDRVRRRSLLPRDLLEKCFPMRVKVEGTDAATSLSFLVWNSVSPTGWPLLNAIGNIDDEQVDRASKLIGASDAGALVHVMHHQLAQPSPKYLVSPPARAPKDRITSGWTVLMRPNSVIDWIESLGQRTVIFHGHKHKYFVANLTDGLATIVSAPSGTLGVEESFVSGFEKSEHGFWLDVNLEVRGSHTSLLDAQPRRASAPA